MNIRGVTHWRTVMMSRSHLIALAALVIVAIGCQPSGLATGSPAPASTAGPEPTPSLSASAEPSAGPSASAAAVAPQEPVEFTGRISCGPPVRGASEATLDVGDGGTVVTQYRGGAWQQSVTMSDPRLEGTVHHTFETDTYRAKGADKDGPELWAATRSIVNAQGAWVGVVSGGSYADGTAIGGEAPTAYIGEGRYTGMIAIMEETPVEGSCIVSVRGVIFAGAPVLMPYVPN
jgi:hypothetical protein